MLTPSFGSELAGGRPDALRAEARKAGSGRRAPRRRRGVRRAIGIRLVGAGFRLIGGAAAGMTADADARALATRVSPREVA